MRAHPRAGRGTDVFDGNTVHTVLSDYQSRTNGGNGWMRIMQFSPSTDQIHVQTYSPVLGQYDTGGSHQFTLPYDMGGSGFTLLGTLTGVASGSTATLDWAGLDPNKAYEWYVTVSDGRWRPPPARPGRSPPHRRRPRRTP